MKKARKVLLRLSALACAVLFGDAAAIAQTAGAASSQVKTHGEISGVFGGSGFLSFDGGGAAADGMWGIKGGGFSRGRFGVEGSFEQSLSYRDLRYLGGDLVFQFRKHGGKKTIPFVHAGAGAFLYEGRGEVALSFGAGVKHYFNERVGIRVGIQDRMLLGEAEYHRLDFYAGVVFRF